MLTAILQCWREVTLRRIFKGAYSKTVAYLNVKMMDNPEFELLENNYVHKHTIHTHSIKYNSTHILKKSCLILENGIFNRYLLSFLVHKH